ncbi:TPA: hypothetical protein ACW72Z_002531 [Aeromonas veronii]|uniref:hypothetical protein n=1 Tax=Aeromonas veronii TaxID=654 RepID=UPI0038E38F9F
MKKTLLFKNTNRREERKEIDGDIREGEELAQRFVKSTRWRKLAAESKDYGTNDHDASGRFMFVWIDDVSGVIVKESRTYSRNGNCGSIVFEQISQWPEPQPARLPGSEEGVPF